MKLGRILPSLAVGTGLAIGFVALAPGAVANSYACCDSQEESNSSTLLCRHVDTECSPHTAGTCFEEQCPSQLI